MHYLTVQDVIWIHLQIAKKQGKFSFAKLEEATSYQYAYGKSHDVIAQATRFFSGFAGLHPFDSGNKAVGFVAGIVFLELNGLAFNPKEKDLGQWYDRAVDPSSGKLAIENGTEPAHGDHHSSTKEVTLAVMSRYKSAIQDMLS